MNKSNLKNIVILNNLPSNLVDEAIIVLKKNKSVKNFQKIDQSVDELEKNCELQNEDYIIKEAEMLVNKYALKCEEKEVNNKTKEKYKKVKIYATLITLIASIETILLIL